jgi:hypothetical protein
MLGAAVAERLCESLFERRPTTPKNVRVCVDRSILGRKDKILSVCAEIETKHFEGRDEVGIQRMRYALL